MLFEYHSLITTATKKNPHRNDKIDWFQTWAVIIGHHPSQYIEDMCDWKCSAGYLCMSFNELYISQNLY